jgi:hypothetical protein
MRNRAVDPVVSAIFAELGRRGGKARMAAITPEGRRDLQARSLEGRRKAPAAAPRHSGSSRGVGKS